MSHRKPILAALLLALVVALPATSRGAPPAATVPPRVPRGFFGITPQTTLTQRDAEYMQAGGIETVRWPMIWALVQPRASGGYDWASMDQAVGTAARAGLRILPSLGTTPHWISHRETQLPVQNARARAAWSAFVEAAVRRYGPGGEFWREARRGIDGEPPVRRALPIREWQIWNEPNFFYFAYPVSPNQFGKLVTISSTAIKDVDPGAKLILGGLFGEPTAEGKRGMPATTFLRRMYRIPGMRNRFDGVDLHPYAIDTKSLEEQVEAFHEVAVENHDPVGLYITEMGWGSQNDYSEDAFEQGIRGQVRELRRAYGYLIENQRALDLRQVDWFSWKDVEGACNFCDSVGLFKEGAGFHPKPAWKAFVALTGGSPRP
jgi:polysaccharide biosynthesis protein PslG